MLKDNYDFWRKHDAEQEKRLSKLPKCSECGEPIQEESCYFINGEYICESCMDNYKVYVDELNF